MRIMKKYAVGTGSIYRPKTSLYGDRNEILIS
jgi:hypothetical protein